MKRGSERTSRNGFPQLTAKPLASHANPPNTRSRLRPLSRQPHPTPEGSSLRSSQQSPNPTAIDCAQADGEASVGYMVPSTFQSRSSTRSRLRLLSRQTTPETHQSPEGSSPHSRQELPTAGRNQLRSSRRRASVGYMVPSTVLFRSSTRSRLRPLSRQTTPETHQSPDGSSTHSPQKTPTTAPDRLRPSRRRASVGYTVPGTSHFAP